MALPERLRRAWYSLESLEQPCERTRWGCVCRPGRAREVTLLDDAFWAGYTAIAAELGGADDARLAHLVGRDRHVFAAAGMRLFGVYENGRLVGNASLQSIERVGSVNNVRTWPACRRRGVATDAVRAAMRASADARDEQCVLETAEGGDARRIYQRLGLPRRQPGRDIRRMIEASVGGELVSTGADPAREKRAEVLGNLVKHPGKTISADSVALAA